VRALVGTLTKKHYVGTAVALTAALFVPFFLFLPIEVAAHRPGNVPLLVVNAGFLAITVALLSVFALIWVTKKDYVKRQIEAFKKFRHLLFLMIKRDFVTRYRRSVLGILWSLLNPVLTMLIMTMVFSQIFRFEIPNYSFAVYYLSGQFIFGFFSESTTIAMSSIVGNGAIIKKVYVPKWVFPISKIMSSLVNMFFSFIAFIVVFIVMGESINWTFLLIPIPIILIFIFSLGVGMLLSSLSVFFRDINHIYGIGVTLLMFMTPLFYPVSILPDRVYYLIHLNPLFHYVTYFRDLTLSGTVPSLWSNIICLGFALAALAIGTFATMSQQDKYILHI